MESIQRYGFHGLSYAYVAAVAPTYMSRNEQESLIVANPGSGAGFFHH
ncbi:hypothetical protein [Pseudomaricurvus alkylphenolicus]